MEVSSATVTNINYIKEDLLDWHKFGISLISKSGRYSILYLKSPEIPVPQTLQSQKVSYIYYIYIFSTRSPVVEKRGS